MGIRHRLAEHYPIFALEVRTPRVTLRYPDDEDLLDMAEVAAGGVHAEGEMPFTVPWTLVPPPFQQRNTLEFFWQARSTAQAEEWNLPLVTVVDGEVVGSQGLMGRSWLVTKQFETGSWLGRAFQGLGIGKEMRAAALALGFDGFGAHRAMTAAFGDNPASIGVTRAMGYVDNGVDIHDRGGRAVDLHRFTMTRSQWEQRRRDDIEIIGAAAVVEQFGSARPPAFPTV